MNTADSETFRKRPGSTDRGRDFEHLYIASLILKLVVDSTVGDFRLSSNEDGCGAFDDVVLFVKRTSGRKEVFSVQLKHIAKGKHLTKNGLAEKWGKFSIKKYHQEFQKLRVVIPTKFVLLTNLKLDAKSGETMTLDGDDSGVRFELGRHDELVGTSGRCYQFSAPGNQYESFFKDFFLYTDQPRVDKLKSDTADQFKQSFGGGDVSFDQFLQFVTCWSMLEGKKERLTKSWTISVITLRVLAPHILPLKFSGDAPSLNGKVFRQAVMTFPVTSLDKQHSCKVLTLWKDQKSAASLQYLNKINSKFQVTTYIQHIDDLNDLDRTKLLWLMGVAPLPLSANDSLERVVRLSDAFRFLVFGPTLCVNTFRKLADLDLDTLCIIKKEFKCSLQGKVDVTLEQLLSDEDVLPLITTDELVQMLDGPFRIGDESEVLPIPHIDRVLTRNIVSMDFINKAKDTLVVISNVKPEDEQKFRRSAVGCMHLTRIEDFSKEKSTSGIKENGNNEIFFTRNDHCPPEQVEDISGKLQMPNWHQFRMFEGELEWLRSSHSIATLKEFQHSTKYIEQRTLLEESRSNRVNIVCADPGMGKSILMKDLKNSSKLWTFLLYPKDHAKYFRGQNVDPHDFINYLTGKTCDPFARQLVEVYAQKHQLLLIWDGLDEVLEDTLRAIIDLILALAGLGYTQWLTSRCNLKSLLEDKFQVLARNIEQFDSEQQNTYIEKRLDCKGSDLEDIKKKIHKCIRYNDILGIPLQIYMFTELFRRNPEKYRRLLSSVFCITDLYRYFVDEKFNIYHQAKANLGDCNEVGLHLLERDKRQGLKWYEEAALKACFRSDVLDTLNIDCEDFLVSVQTSCDKVGIIVAVTEDKIPSFLHNSYGEYFAASFLRKNYHRLREFCSFIFDEANSNIRFLFDLLMAEDCPVHIAVLYKNLEMLLTHHDQVERRDAGGRTPLHLACSWGKRYHQTGYAEEIDVEEQPQYMQIVEYLAERCDPFVVDTLFQLNAFEYSSHTCCLLPLLVLANKHQFNIATLNPCVDLNTILFNAIKYDYPDVFEDLPLMNLKDKSLLHESVYYGSIKCLKKILTNPTYKHSINEPTVAGLTPFLLACHNGHLEIIDTLIAAGADTTATTSGGWGGVYQAARSSHVDAVKFLVQSGVDINARGPSGKTALHLACENNEPEVVRMLIDLGADVDREDHFGYTALYLACRHKNKMAVDLLLSHGADVNAPNVHGDFPLFMAAWNGEVDTVGLLLEKGADVNAANNRGHGAIHACCLNDMCGTEVLGVLIGAGVDVDAPDRYGHTPLHLSLRSRFRGGIRILLEARADVAIKNGYGETFWDMGLRYYKRDDLERFIVNIKGAEYCKWMKESFDKKGCIVT